MLPRSSDTDAFWQEFRRYTAFDHDNYVVGSFGGSLEMATELADLVIAGIKRATASFALRASLAASPPSLARDYGEGHEPIPRPGDFVMMLDGEGRPRFIWRTTEVMIKPLSQVDDAFAWDEGEGDRTRDWWLDAHRRYFARQASREGFELDDDILSNASRWCGRSMSRIRPPGRKSTGRISHPSPWQMVIRISMLARSAIGIGYAV
jgi:uncharacterized protein YhfF